jgi:sialate O-acetylesterase
LLKAIDGKDQRTFAYPCGDLKVGDSLFYNRLRNDFSGARGVTPVLQHVSEINLDNINSFMINDKPGSYMIDLVKQAEQSGTLLVFLFHGVGGGHPLNVSLAAHSELLHYLKAHEKDIWIATMNDVAIKIREIQSKKH